MPAVPDEAIAPDAEAAAEENIGTDAALELIGSLPPDQAEVVLLSVVVGFDSASVAEVLGKRAGTVRVLSHRGLKRLSAMLTKSADGRSDRLPASMNNEEV